MFARLGLTQMLYAVGGLMVLAAFVVTFFVGKEQAKVEHTQEELREAVTVIERNIHLQFQDSLRLRDNNIRLRELEGARDALLFNIPSDDRCFANGDSERLRELWD